MMHQNQAEKDRGFLEQLEYASRVVATWPAWKKAALGGVRQTKQVEPEQKQIKPERGGARWIEI